MLDGSPLKTACSNSDTAPPQSAEAESGWAVRAACRLGLLSGHTSGRAPGYVQVNLAIVPAQFARDFQDFCTRNPQSCPLLAVSEVGDPTLPGLGDDLDVRFDLPRYRLWRDGTVVEELTDLEEVWRSDLVTFALGCSFTFEEALMEAGLEVRNVSQGSNVPMYRTNVPCVPAGPFSGPLVVSMRPFSPADAIKAVQITSRYPAVHGAPVHLGRPDLIGVADLSKPDYGDPVFIGADELPVFWACGVTPQSVLMTSGVPFAITHAPGCMLVTDMRNDDVAIL